MFRKKTILATSAFVCAAISMMAFGGTSQQGEGTQEKAWLEGAIHYDDGRPWGSYPFERIHVFRDGRAVANTSSNSGYDGLFEFHDLRPGVYEIRVDNPESGQYQQGLRIWGVSVKAGVRNRLNITLHEGNGLREIGQPVVPTENVMVLSQEISKMKQEIDALKKKG